VGKRSRKRGGLEVAERPLPPRDEAAGAPAQARSPRGTRPPTQSQYADPPATTLLGRFAESWRLAGERPSRTVPKGERVRERPERPVGIFGGVPVSEIAMLAGLIGLIIGFARGPDVAETTISVSLAAIALGAFELAAREHFSGYRSHSLFLAMIVTVAVHAAIALGIGGDAGKSPLLILLDIGLFSSLAWTLGGRYKRARRELRGGRK